VRGGEAAGESGLERGHPAQERVEQEVAVVAGWVGLRRRRRVGVGVGFGLLLLVPVLMLVWVGVRIGIRRVVRGGRRRRRRRLGLGLRLRRWLGGRRGAEEEVGGDGVEEVVGRGGAGRGRHGRGVVARRRARAAAAVAAAASAAAAGGRGRVVVAVARHPRSMRRGSLGVPGTGIGGGGVVVTGSSGGKEMRFGAEAPDCPCRPCAGRCGLSSERSARTPWARGAAVFGR
jgi:hypothetical protein